MTGETAVIVVSYTKLTETYQPMIGDLCLHTDTADVTVGSSDKEC